MWWDYVISASSYGLAQSELSMVPYTINIIILAKYNIFNSVHDPPHA